MDTKLHSITDIVKDRGLQGCRYKVKFAVKNLELVPVCFIGRSGMFDSRQRKQVEKELDRIAGSK